MEICREAAQLGDSFPRQTVLQIREWFNQIVANNRASTNKINQGFLEGEAETIQQELTMFLGETILVWASGDILELSVMSELPEISGNYNARACMV